MSPTNGGPPFNPNPLAKEKCRFAIEHGKNETDVPLLAEFMVIFSFAVSVVFQMELKSEKL